MSRVESITAKQLSDRHVYRCSCGAWTYGRRIDCPHLDAEEGTRGTEWRRSLRTAPGAR